MICVLASLVAFLCAILIHIAWCRVRRIKAIAVTSFCVITIGIFMVLAWWQMVGIADCPLKWTSLVLYLALLPFYICFYHSIIVNSPTRLLLDQCGQGPCRYEQLLASTIQEDFVQDRLEALVESGVVSKVGETYRLAPQGRLLGKILAWYQHLVGRPMGG